VCKGAVPCPYGREGKDHLSQILALIQITTRGLLRWICLRMPLVGDIKHGVLLDPVTLHRDLGHTEAGIFRDVNGIEFRRIALLVHCAERTNQSSINRFFPCSSKAPSRAGTRQPDKMPARLADHRIEHRGRDFVHKHPVSAKRLPKWIQMTRQDASFTQENGMELHACALLDTVGATVLLESGEAASGEASSPLEEGC